MMQELSGHPLFCYDDRNQVIGLVGISFDSKMTQIQNLYHRIPADSFLRRFTPNHYKGRLMWNSKVRTAMFLDVQSRKDWILSVVEENPVTNSKPFWIRTRLKRIESKTARKCSFFKLKKTFFKLLMLKGSLSFKSY